MKRIHVLFAVLLLLAGTVEAGRTGPWPKERAWDWYRAQPWIRGCNYMPASAANRVDQWQALGSEERFQEVERELVLAESIGFNTLRLIIELQGFGVWLEDPQGFRDRFERYLKILNAHKMRAIVVLGNDCMRPKSVWKLPKPGPQKYDIGYHGGRRLSQHGSFPNEIGYSQVDDPKLKAKFFQMCEELMTAYANDDRILFWNLWNEPGNNNRGSVSVQPLRELFELAWRIDPKQPIAADVWVRDYGLDTNSVNRAQILAGQFSDIISYHCYSGFNRQRELIARLRKGYGRPLINTEWLARINHNDVFSAYPLFASEGVGCTCWGFVAGKYQTYEPWEGMWKELKNDTPTSRTWNMAQWLHDLYRPSLRPYDPKEIDAIKRINAEMDADAKGLSLRKKIAAKHTVTREDFWYGYRRINFTYKGRQAWIVEPTVSPIAGTPWTWTMQWAEAFVDRTGVLDLLKRGFHHVTIDLYDTKMDATGVAAAADFQKFLIEELGFAPKANLVGMSWGGFFSIRYAANHPQNVRRIFLDCPLLNFAGFVKSKDFYSWHTEGDWATDERMPINLAAKVAEAKIPVLLRYGGADLTVKPETNAELFIERFKAASGKITVRKDTMYGHHPHGYDPDKTGPVIDFFSK